MKEAIGVTEFFPDFTSKRIEVDEGVALHTLVGGSGDPIVLLHGFPQTHLMWRDVAVQLAVDHTVICPDLRGYGQSDKPPEADEHTYSKRTMANDVVALAAALRFERFALVGHDRGALVAFRAGLDHPDVIRHLACLDGLPTQDLWDVLHGVRGATAFHLYLMAQPPSLPEQMIRATADAFFSRFLDGWGGVDYALPLDVRDTYLAASREAVDSIVADYRASAGVDLEHDRADADTGTRLTMPTTVLQQDWGSLLGYDAAAIWRRWAPDVDHITVTCGHWMAEEEPDTVVEAVRSLLRR
jgi:haloacetate dehalogenase